MKAVARLRGEPSLGATATERVEADSLHFTFRGESVRPRHQCQAGGKINLAKLVNPFVCVSQPYLLA